MKYAAHDAIRSGQALSTAGQTQLTKVPLKHCSDDAGGSRGGRGWVGVSPLLEGARRGGASAVSSAYFILDTAAGKEFQVVIAKLGPLRCLLLAAVTVRVIVKLYTSSNLKFMSDPRGCLRM